MQWTLWKHPILTYPRADWGGPVAQWGTVSVALIWGRIRGTDEALCHRFGGRALVTRKRTVALAVSAILRWQRLIPTSATDVSVMQRPAPSLSVAWTSLRFRPKAPSSAPRCRCRYVYLEWGCVVSPPSAPSTRSAATHGPGRCATSYPRLPSVKKGTEGWGLVRYAHHRAYRRWQSASLSNVRVRTISNPLHATSSAGPGVVDGAGQPCRRP